MKGIILKNGDRVILNPEKAHLLYGGVQYHKDIYEELHKKNIQGEVTNFKEYNNHYLYGYYGDVDWDNKMKTECIHTSWLKQIQ